MLRLPCPCPCPSERTRQPGDAAGERRGPHVPQHTLGGNSQCRTGLERSTVARRESAPSGTTIRAASAPPGRGLGSVSSRSRRPVVDAVAARRRQPATLLPGAPWQSQAVQTLQLVPFLLLLLLEALVSAATIGFASRTRRAGLEASSRGESIARGASECIQTARASPCTPPAHANDVLAFGQQNCGRAAFDFFQLARLLLRRCSSCRKMGSAEYHGTLVMILTATRQEQFVWLHSISALASIM